MSDEIPIFMAEDIPLTEPELDRAALTASPEVIVIESRYGGNRVTRSEVVSVARVWVEIMSTDNRSLRCWRLRLDTQNDGSKYNPQAWFRTPGQHAYHEARDAANVYLRAQGIQIDHGSAWMDRRIELARLVWLASGGVA